VAVTGSKRPQCSAREKFGAPQIVNDVTIAKEIELEDHGKHVFRQAASKTNDAAGDGTTIGASA